MTRPRPVLTAASFTSLGTSLAGIATFLGYAQQSGKIPGVVEAVGSVVIAVLGLAHVGAAAAVQQKVTPTADPRDDQGRPLAPAVDVRTVPALEPVSPVAAGPGVAMEPPGN